MIINNEDNFDALSVFIPSYIQGVPQGITNLKLWRNYGLNTIPVLLNNVGKSLRGI